MKNYACPECGITYSCDPNDPAAGSLCNECGQRAYDNAVPIPLDEERIQEIVDYVLSQEQT